MVISIVFFIGAFVSALINMILHSFVHRAMKKNCLEFSYINGYRNLYILLLWAKMNKSVAYKRLAYSNIFFIVLMVVLMISYLISFIR